jgi:AraC-like DNA-binding protein
VERLLGCFDRVKITPDEGNQQSLREMVKELYETEDELDFALRLAGLLQLLGKCESARLEGSTVGAIVSYINHNFGSIRQISQIADHFYISRFHLCRIFKDAMKMTVVDYLNRVRIQSACRYLHASDKDMGEIALLCGFHDAAYFSNVFKRVQGITPREYRRKG